ncbi:hypothetical protein QBC47DRAFT_461485 [Echria macrotheca]|uniref:Small secreted protein n=1 Tax=Echria macrotheca TaxID=438768 RepID=A0AAJ0F4A2_9PEZI|nr:hypothetical protein QBC47DRAFT_461485 [Echria macrotheca]
MQFQKLAMQLGALFAAFTQALPVDQPIDVLTLLDVPKWTIEDLRRECNSADTVCSWDFIINPHLFPKVPCHFETDSRSSVPASRAPLHGGKCGPYSLYTGWSGQFGIGHGYTTLSIVDHVNKIVVYPAYTDEELAGGQPVKPDLSFPAYEFHG